MNTINQETKKILHQCFPQVLLKVFISVIYRGTLLVIPLIWGMIIELLTKGEYHECNKIIFIIIIVTVLYYISVSINQVVYYKLYNKMYKKYCKLIYSSTIDNSLYSLSRFKIGEFTNIINNDIDIVVAFISDAIIKIIQIMEFLIIYYYFYKINFIIFIVTLIVSILMVVLLVLTRFKTREFNKTRKINLDKKVALSHEVFNTIKEIKGFHIFKSVNKRLKKSCDIYLKSHAKYNTFSTVIKQIILVIIEIVRYVVILFGVHLCMQGKMEIGTIVVIYTYYGKTIDNYGIISSLMIGYEDFKVSLSRLNKLLEYRANKSDVKDIPLNNYEGNIEFIDVLYGNRKDPILNKVSFVIPKNGITTITGGPGTGKTGVFDLLMKLNRKHEGNIIIDGTCYEQISDNNYYNLVSLVRKEPHFFDLSIAENLMLVCDDYDLMIKVCKQIGIHDEIERLKNGYDTGINDVTEKISKDLKVAVAVARVLLKDSKIMMFDETIGMLSSKCRENVIDLLKDLSKNHTIILISRDESVCKLAHNVITFESNQIKEVKYNG